MDKVGLAIDFRRAIIRRYNVYNWSTAFIGLMCVLIFTLSKRPGITNALSELSFAFAVGLLIRNITHRLKLLGFLEGLSQLPALEDYLQEKQIEWQKAYWIRILLGCGILLAMIFLMIYDPQSSLPLLFASIFIVFIIGIAVLGWINFNDQLFLQDVRRSHRDQPSNIPE